MCIRDKIRTQQSKYLLFYAFLQILTLALPVLAWFIYPGISRIVMNHMCMLFSVGLIVLTRLDLTKAIKQLIICLLYTSKRGEQGIIDLCQHFFICDQCAQKDEDKDCRVGKHMQNGKEAEEKQNDVKPDQRRLFLCSVCGRILD